MKTKKIAAVICALMMTVNLMTANVWAIGNDSEEPLTPISANADTSAVYYEENWSAYAVDVDQFVSDAGNCIYIEYDLNEGVAPDQQKEFELLLDEENNSYWTEKRFVTGDGYFTLSVPEFEELYDNYDEGDKLILCGNSSITVTSVKIVKPTQKTKNGITYRCYDNYAEILSYNRSLTSLTIPQAVDGLKVRKMLPNSDRSDSKLKTLNVPATLTSVGEGALFGCADLQSAVFEGNTDLYYYCGLGYSAGEEEYWDSFNNELVITAKYGTSPAEYANNNGIGLTYSDAQTSGGYTYIVNSDGEAEIIRYTGEETVITVPNTLGGKTVTGINEKVFVSNGWIRKITLPTGLRSIGEEAFSNCYSLEEVVFRSNAETLGYSAFFDCTALTKINFPATLTDVPNSAAYGSKWQDDQIAAGKFVVIGDTLVDGSGVKGKATVPEDVRVIASNAISNNSQLTELTIGSNVEKIGYNAIDNCSNLKTLRIDSTADIDSLGIGYYRDEDYNYHYFEDEVTIICPYGSPVYWYATNNGYRVEFSDYLSENGVKYIIADTDTEYWDEDLGEYVREKGAVVIGCDEGIKKLVIPETLGGYKTYSVGFRAFSGNTSLTELTLPKELEYVDSDALVGCSNLKKLTVQGKYTRLYDSEAGFAENGNRYPLTIYCCYGSNAYNYADTYGFDYVYTDLNSEGDFDYLISDDNTSVWDEDLGEWVVIPTADIVRYTGNSASVTIPDTLGGYRVYSVCRHAFKGNTTLKEVHFNNTEWMYVQGAAFDGCTSLAKAYFEGESDVELQDHSMGYSFAGYDEDYGMEQFNKTANITFYCTSNTDALSYARENEFPYVLTDCERSGDIFYKLNDEKNKAYIIDYAGTASTLTIPDTLGGVTVTEIEEQAFRNKTSLKKLVLPGKLTDINYEAFEGCTNLAAITFPDTLRFVSSSALTDTAWYKNAVAGGGLVIAGGVLLYGNNASGKVVIPDKVLKINSYAFEGCTGITSVQLNEKLSYVENDAFMNCSNIKEVICNSRDTDFDGYCIGFSDCDYETDQRTRYDSTVFKCYYGSTAYYYAINYGFDYELIGVQTSGNYKYVTDEDGDVIIVGYTGKEKKITVPETIGEARVYGIDRKVFAGNSTVTEIILPDSIGVIREDAFANCPALKKLTVKSDEPIDRTGVDTYTDGTGTHKKTGLTICADFGSYSCDFAMENGYTFVPLEGRMSGDFLIVDNDYNDGVTVQGYLGSASKLTVPAQLDGKKVTYIDGNCFKYNNGGITELTISEGITGHGWSMFEYLTSLKKLSYPGSMESVDSDLRDCTQLEEVVLGSGLKYIYGSAFSGLTKLSKITIPSTVIEIGTAAFADTPWLAAQRKKNPLVIVNSIIVDGQTCTGSLVVPDGITMIAGEAFLGSSITSVTLKKSVQQIGYRAFLGCRNIKQVTVYGETSLSSYSFGYSYDEKNDEVPDSDFLIRCDYNTSAHRYAVDNGFKYELMNVNTNSDFEYAVNSDNTVTIIKYLGKGGAVTIPEKINGVTVKDIANEAFKDNKTVTSVTMSDSLQGIDYSAFEGCTALKTVKLSKNIRHITSSMFKDCTALTSVTMPEGDFMGIGSEAFKNCKALTSITIPKGCNWLEYAAFSGCTSLSEVNVLSDTVRNIGDQVFKDTKFRQDQLDKTGMFIACRMLLETKGLTGEVKVPSGVWLLGYSAFNGSPNVTSVTIPNTVEIINYGAMNALEKLTKIVISSSVNSIGYPSFGVKEGYDDEGNYTQTVNQKLTVYCAKGSEAESYAKRYGMKISYIESDLPGDVNGDSRVNMVDVGMMRLYIKDKNTKIVFKNADLNGDNKVDDKDLELIKKTMTDVHYYYGYGMG